MRGALLFMFTTLVAACVDYAPPPEEQGETTAHVQTAAASHYTVATTSLTGAVALAQRATGALIVPRFLDGQLVTAPDGTPIRSTCGVTFIDRTHAITAAHCADDVDVPDPTARSLDVQFIDVSPTSNWRDSTKLSGTFPDYQHDAITTGYTTTTISCQVAHRCNFGEYKCPPAATAANADIMMLECAEGLPADREPVAVAKADAERGAVKLFWFHELYDTPTAQPPANDTANSDLFAHYTAADPTGAQNFHYFGGDRNQLLPLVSADWANGTARTRLRRESTRVFTDLFGCHGTSGSGVMQLDAATGRYQYLGPVATASRDWGSDRLCVDLATHRAGRESLSYTAAEFTREMAALAN